MESLESRSITFPPKPKRKRVTFNTLEKEQLEKAYHEEMDSASLEKLPQIQELARKLNKDEQEIKVAKRTTWEGGVHAKLGPCSLQTRRGRGGHSYKER